MDRTAVTFGSGLLRDAVPLLAAAMIGCGGGDLSGPAPPAQPPTDAGVEPSEGCSEGTLAHGALFRVCFPASWNGDLVLYAHGYVAPDQPLALPDDGIGGQSVSGATTGLGYAFGTTSYRANGLVVPEAVADLLELQDTIERRYRPDPARTVIVGFSEGGLVASLAAEREPARVAGALAGCGPIGSFRAQLDYIGDFRVVFDYFFPGVLPGSAVDVPSSVQAEWTSRFVPAILAALGSDPDAARQLIAVTGASVAADDIASIGETTIGLLWYNVFGTADARARLGGQPFENAARVYSGSSNDAALNGGVARYQADPAALESLASFETTGSLEVPVVTIHTTGDPVIPFQQEALYAEKVGRAGATAMLSQISVTRAGHCTFQAPEILGAFVSLWQKIGAAPAATASRP
jgi:pimeloyl-ACP methyl ester carboxylesterase